MTDFAHIVIGRSSVPALILTAIGMVALPVAFLLLWRRKHRGQTRIRWLVAGLVGFLLSARVLELGVHAVCLLADHPVSRFLNGNTAAYVLYGITTAGVFEECGRHLILKHVMKKDRSPENAVLYGIGHGGIEIFAVVLPMILTELAVALLFSTGDVESALRALNITGENAAAALPTVQAAASFDFAAMALNLFERLNTMLIHIGLTVIVFDGVCRGRKTSLPLAILLHMLVDTLPALYQRGAAPLWAVEIVTALWAAGITVLARKRCGRLEGPSSAESIR